MNSKKGIFSNEAQALFSRLNKQYSCGELDNQTYTGNHQSLIKEWDDNGLPQYELTVQELLRQAQMKKTPGDN